MGRLGILLNDKFRPIGKAITTAEVKAEITRIKRELKPKREKIEKKVTKKQVESEFFQHDNYYKF